MDRPSQRRLLLDLAFPARPPAAPTLAELGEAEWSALDEIAAEHRIQPLLHRRQGGNEAVPPGIRQSWREAHRGAALEALAQQADLKHCVGLLEAHGFAPVALKGAWLARYAYPEPALRPLRDFDLLLPTETVIAAYELLSAEGYRKAYDGELPLAEQLRFDHQMPPLIAPNGTWIELHQRVWWPDGRVDHRMPRGIENKLRARAVRADGVAYPAPGDLLAHLIVHAVYSHRLDCGPLVLSDIRYLLERYQPDWPAFWQTAREEGWAAGAALILALVRRYEGETAAPAPPAADSALDDMVRCAPDLMLQPLDRAWGARLMAMVLTAGPGLLMRRLAGRTSAKAEGSVMREMKPEGGYLGWARNRLRRAWSELSDGSVRRQSRDLARLSRWLDRAR